MYQADPQPLLDQLRSADVDRQESQRGFEVLASWSSLDRLAGITTPALVVGGRHDPITAWPQQVRIATRIPGAALLLLDDTSHFVWVDQPDEFWAAVDRFLAAQG